MVWLIVAGAVAVFLAAYRRAKPPMFIIAAVITGGVVAASGPIVGEVVALMVSLLIWLPALFLGFVVHLIRADHDDADVL